ncbi:MAG TPA: 3-dehydro-L-gulonate 2-dehydrogenase [Phycisphaerae bacterium]|nr:3-dehydro-L-gulonate 2-dehydrogenase [Phycisphaerae bacterium]
MRVPFERMCAEFRRVLIGLGMARERAGLCAELFAGSSLDGVHSHGLNRFPSFVRHIREGRVDVHAAPTRIAACGPIERWEGHRGPGPLNAHFAMARAIELAREHGMGCVALRNTNHWMRAGSYGWQAAEAGCIGICWTNTISNMPPWGAKTPTVGNNPFVIAVPRPLQQGSGQAAHVVLDMAMSLFSWGRMDSYRRAGQPLPVPGGYDQAGELTCDPDAVFASRRPLPAGLWKGSGLALMLDLTATLLAAGNAAWQIDQAGGWDVGASQVFIAFDTGRLPPAEIDNVADRIIEHFHTAEPIAPDRPVLYPGERAYRTRQENLKSGIPVDPETWQKVLEM